MLRHLSLIVLLFLTAQTSVAEKARPTQPEIDRLVLQLGSKSFEEREAASRALEKVGFPALDTLRKAARSEDRETRRRAGLLVQQIENGLDALLAAYKEYGLPLPPKDAQLVRVVAVRANSGPGRMATPRFTLAFRLPPGAAPGTPRLLIGTAICETDPDSEKIEVLRPAAADLKGFDPCWFRTHFTINAGLAVAVQCHARGWGRLAREVLDTSLGQPCGSPSSLFYQPARQAPRTALAYVAWAHWANEIATPGTDRAVIARRMRSLLEAEQALDTEANRALLKSLAATQRPSRAKPGTTEALIDGLVDLTEESTAPEASGSAYWRLGERGFDAVPAMIAHLDDDRLTRNVYDGLGLEPKRHVRVRDALGELLQGLAGEDLGLGLRRRLRGYAVEKAQAQEWWEGAREEGEEAYLVAHVLPDKPRAEWPNDLMLRIIAKRYPRRLPEVYRTLLDEQPKLYSDSVAEAVGKSSLPRQEKVELFLRASRHKDLRHRKAALRELKGLDAGAFVERLVETLETLPAKPKERCWMCEEAPVAGLVLQTADPRAWRALERAARRADVGLRLEILKAAGELAGPHRKERLAFLAAFLGDATVRDTWSDPEMYYGCPAGHEYSRLEVRDYATLELATLLKLPEKPKPEWKPEQWSALRAKVKQALKQEQVKAGTRWPPHPASAKLPGGPAPGTLSTERKKVGPEPRSTAL